MAGSWVPRFAGRWRNPRTRRTRGTRWPSRSCSAAPIAAAHRSWATGRESVMSAKANKARSRRAELGMHHQLFVSTLGVLVALLVSVGAVSAQPQDPESVFGAFEAAFNAHDEEAT